MTEILLIVAVVGVFLVWLQLLRLNLQLRGLYIILELHHRPAGETDEHWVDRVEHERLHPLSKALRRLVEWSLAGAYLCIALAIVGALLYASFVFINIGTKLKQLL